MGEESQYAYLSTIQALKQAKIDENFLLQNSIGILFGNDSVSQAVVESTDIVREKKRHRTCRLRSDFQIYELHGEYEFGHHFQT